MKTASITLHEFAIGYADKHSTRVIAEHINADINSGELTCLLGANGAGKSTLLRTLSGFQPALGGGMSLMGKDFNGYTDKELAQLISIVLTEKCTIRNMTSRELIELGRSPYTGFWGKLEEKDEKVVRHAMSLVRIESLAERMLQTLSDGERQKVMIAKTLAQETPIIFLDEPTAFLDFPSKVEIMKLLHYLSHTLHKTVFMSTHDLELALQIADKIWLMGRESGISIGTPEDLALEGRLEHFFSHKGVVFNPDTGLFQIENECQREIRLTGSGCRYAMVRKALSRNGIAASQNANSCDAIAVENDTIIYSDIDGITYQAATINDLLSALDITAGQPLYSRQSANP